jgi:hypothetical protein
MIASSQAESKITLYLVGLAAWLLLIVLADRLLIWAGLEALVALPLAALASIVLAILAARPIATRLIGGTIRPADENAAARLAATTAQGPAGL